MHILRGGHVLPQHAVILPAAPPKQRKPRPKSKVVTKKVIAAADTESDAEDDNIGEGIRDDASKVKHKSAPKKITKQESSTVAGKRKSWKETVLRDDSDEDLEDEDNANRDFPEIYPLPTRTQKEAKGFHRRTASAPKVPNTSFTPINKPATLDNNDKDMKTKLRTRRESMVQSNSDDHKPKALHLLNDTVAKDTGIRKRRRTVGKADSVTSLPPVADNTMQDVTMTRNKSIQHRVDGASLIEEQKEVAAGADVLFNMARQALYNSTTPSLTHGEE